MKPDEHYFRNLRYKIHWRVPKGYPKGTGGTCSSPNDPKRAIEIHPNLKGLNKMRVLLDEGIHACMFDLDNDAVDEMSTSLSAWLWNCGCRFIEDE